MARPRLDDEERRVRTVGVRIRAAEARAQRGAVVQGSSYVIFDT